MRPAVDIYKDKIKDFVIKDLTIPVIANWTAREIKTSQEITEAMINQIIYPVRWIESIEYLHSRQVDRYVEIGPGTVLSGLIKKIDKSAKIYNIDKLSDLNKLKE